MLVQIYNKGSHKGIWNWCGKNPTKSKKDWPGNKTIEKYGLTEIMSSPTHFKYHHCFACQEAEIDEYKDSYEEIDHYSINCKRCPINFNINPKGNKMKCQTNPHSIYEEWIKCMRGGYVDKRDMGIRSALAFEIAKRWE